MFLSGHSLSFGKEIKGIANKEYLLYNNCRYILREAEGFDVAGTRKDFSEVLRKRKRKALSEKFPYRD